MTDEQKTKKQLIAELKELRKTKNTLTVKLKSLNGGSVDREEIPRKAKGRTRYRKSNQRHFKVSYETLIDLLPVGLLISTLDGEMLDASINLVQLAGYDSRAEFLKTKTYDHWFDLKERDKAIEKLKKGSLQGFRAQFKKKDGSTYWALLSTVPVKSDSGTIWLTTITDITDRVSVEDALKESEEKFRTLADESPNMIFINKGGRIVYVNRKCEELMGYTKEEYYREDFNFMALIHPDYIDAVNDRFQQHQAGSDIPGYEYAIVTKAGDTLDTIISTKLIRYEDRQAILGIVTDITERKRDEARLVELSASVEQSVEGFATSDMDGNLTYCNEAFASAHGYARDELIDKNLSIFHNKSQLPSVKKANQQLKKEGRFSGEIWHTKQDGTVFPTVMNNSLLHDAEGKAIGMLANLHDITDQKLAEEALLASEERYRKLVETSPDAITLVDLQGRFLTANQQACRQLGYDSLADLLASGKSAFDFIAPEDQEQAVENMKLTLQDGAVRNVEYDMIRRDGSTFHGELNASLLTDADGNPTAFIGVTRDITERKMVEDALRQSEERYRKLIEISPDAITMTDLEGNFLTINQQAVRMLGFENSDELQAYYGNSVNAIAKADRAKSASRAEELIEKGYTANVVYNLIRKDGVIFPVEVSSSVVYGPEGNPYAIIGVARDITERRETEAALRTSETRHRKLIETSPDAILYASLNRKLITLNAKAAELFGYDSVEDMLIAGINVTKLIIREDLSRALEMGKILRASARVENAHFTFLRNDGSTFPGEVSVSMMFDDGGAPEAFVGIVRDITERKKAEEQIRRYGAELERLVEERTRKIRELEKQRTESEKLVATGRMAARIAHEINNPLAGIKNSFMLIKDAVPHDHKYYNYVSLIDKEIDRIAGIVEQMFYLYRPTHQSVQTFRLSKTLDEIIRLLNPICEEKSITIENRLSRRDGIDLTMPENLLRQILYNLLLNAIEASPSGKSVILETKIVKDQLEISVTDFGRGILKEDKSRIFEPFFSTKSHLAKPGLGLGLSISKSLIEAMHGEIDFRSTQNKQTVFKVTLPCRISTEEESDG